LWRVGGGTKSGLAGDGERKEAGKLEVAVRAVRAGIGESERVGERSDSLQSGRSVRKGTCP